MYFLKYLNAFTFIYTSPMKWLSLSKSFAVFSSTFSILTLVSTPSSAAAFNPLLKSASSPPPHPPATYFPSVKSFMPFYELSHHESINHFSEKANHFGEEVGKNIVLSVSAGLPKFDSVGHKILSANHDFIADILKNEILSHAAKKSIILGSIKLAQMGDDMGSHILQTYYNLVDACL